MGSINNPKINIFFFIVVTCLLDFVLILSGEILSWSLVGGNYIQSTPKCKWLKKIHRLAPFGPFVFFCTPFVFMQIEELKKQSLSWIAKVAIHQSNCFVWCSLRQPQIMPESYFQFYLNVVFCKLNASRIIISGLGLSYHPLHPNVIMHILLTVLYTFPKVLTRRFC